MSTVFTTAYIFVALLDVPTVNNNLTAQQFFTSIS